MSIGVRKRRLGVVALSAIVVASTSPAFAAPGDLDPSFNGVGTLISTFVGDAIATAVDPSDNSIVAVGRSSGDVVVARFSSTGAPDMTFGSGGASTIDLGGSGDLAVGASVSQDGSIVVGAGQVDAGDGNFAVVKLDAAGTPDPSFGGGDGIGLAHFGFGKAEPNAVTFDGKGRTVVVGSVTNATQDQRFAVARFLTDGARDLDFGHRGKTTVAFKPDGGAAFAVTVGPNGSLFVVGERQTSPELFAVAKLTRKGALDPTFSDDGWGSVGWPQSGTGARATTAIVLPSGKVLIGGPVGLPIGTARFRPNGILDPHFDKNGKRIALLPMSGEGVTAIIFGTSQPDGTMDFAGTFFDSSEYGPLVVQVLPDGSLDTAFGAGGEATAALSPDAFGYGVTVQPDGNVLWAGTDGSNLALARFLGS